MAYISKHEWRPPHPDSMRANIFLTNAQDGSQLCLNGLNTYVRTFTEGDGRYDHFAVVMAPTNVAAFPAEGPYRGVVGMLRRQHFPEYHDQTPEAEVREWFDQRASGGDADPSV